MVYEVIAYAKQNTRNEIHFNDGMFEPMAKINGFSKLFLAAQLFVAAACEGSLIMRAGDNRAGRNNGCGNGAIKHRSLVTSPDQYRNNDHYYDRNRDNQETEITAEPARSHPSPLDQN